MHKSSRLPLASLLATPPANATERARLNRRLNNYTRSRDIALGPDLQVLFEDAWTQRLPSLAASSALRACQPPLPSLPPPAADGPGWTGLVRIHFRAQAVDEREQQCQLLREAVAQLCLELPHHERVPARMLGGWQGSPLSGASSALRVVFKPSAAAHRVLAAEADPMILLMCAHRHYWRRRLLPRALRQSLRCLLVDAPPEAALGVSCGGA